MLFVFACVRSTVRLGLYRSLWVGPESERASVKSSVEAEAETTEVQSKMIEKSKQVQIVLLGTKG